jgi:hypothetical protein
LASQTTVCTSSATTNEASSRPVELPGVGRVSVRTQSGVPRGAFFSKKYDAPVPSGQRLRVSGRSDRWGSSRGAIWW